MAVPGMALVRRTTGPFRPGHGQCTPRSARLKRPYATTASRGTHEYSTCMYTTFQQNKLLNNAHLAQDSTLQRGSPLRPPTLGAPLAVAEPTGQTPRSVPEIA
eukprot:3936157-Rhodomonas_salina.2